MESSLGSLYPSIYRGIIEIDELVRIGDGQQNRWFTQTETAHSNQFVQSADADGISWLERLYEIRAEAQEDLEFRRRRLLARMRQKPPFTLRFLREWLVDTCGPEPSMVEVNSAKSTIHLRVSGEDRHMPVVVDDMLNRVLPAHMQRAYTVYLERDHQIHPYIAIVGLQAKRYRHDAPMLAPTTFVQIVANVGSLANNEGATRVPRGCSWTTLPTKRA